MDKLPDFFGPTLNGTRQLGLAAARYHVARGGVGHRAPTPTLLRFVLVPCVLRIVLSIKVVYLSKRLYIDIRASPKRLCN